MVSKLTGRHVRNLRSESRAAGSRERREAGRGTCPQWKAPLWRRTGVGGAVKPFTLSEHTLNYSHLSAGVSVNVKVIAQLPPFFLSATRASFLPRLFRLPLISWSVDCGGPLTKQLNGSLVSRLRISFSDTLTLRPSFFLPLNRPAVDPMKRQRRKSLHQVHLQMEWSPPPSWRSVCFLGFLSSPATEMRPDQLFVEVH